MLGLFNNHHRRKAAISSKRSPIMAPRIGANRYSTRIWEPPASRIFSQLWVNRFLHCGNTDFTSTPGQPEARCSSRFLNLLPRLKRTSALVTGWSQ